MTQEKIEDNLNEENVPEENVNTEINKEEKSKKILLVFVILILFGCTYFYYNNWAKNKPNIIVKKGAAIVNKVMPQKDVKTTDILAQEVDDEVIVKKENLTAQKPKNPASNESNVIKPTNKEALVKMAMASKGKSDPFEGLVGKSPNPIRGIKNIPNFKIGSLPVLPNAKGLPTFNGLPSLSNLNGFKTLKNNDSIEVKGFIGNKVIVNVNGIIESLKPNETFQDIKVLSVDNRNLTVKFKKNNKIITKNIKSLTDVDNKNDIKLVKYIKR